ncbi:hypothetical protein [Falsiroseomonas oryziterrae]|uniref:hypothetical protein n=1 Tax=Falsiroseomonas oryziterrae TaxID=2911368 RepID=UPI001F29A026|nr:hypothetical protein [Roseomonas sp. NPKOSM-4]
MRRVVLLLLCLLAWDRAAAQGTSREAELAAKIGLTCFPAGPDGRVATTGGEVRAAIVAHVQRAAPAARLEGVRQVATAVTTIALTIRPPDLPAEDPWRARWPETYFAAVLVPAGEGVGAAGLRLASVRPPAPERDRTGLQIEFDQNAGWLPSRWDVLVFACHGQEIRAFGEHRVYLSSLRLSAAAGLASVAGLYLVLALASAHVQARQFAHAREVARRDGADLSRLAFALRPTVIMQDAFGHCSLSRFQVLLFTLVLTGVYAYVMVRTGELPDLSPTVLMLLGITLAGATLARAADGPVVDTPNRLWLLGTGVIDPTPRLPRWRDLLAGDGEIDVTRVQAVVFSLFAAVALVVNGTANLEQFEIPDQIVQLMGISQAVYVAGKALPREAATRLNAEIRALREAENAALAAPGDPAAQRAFETARNAAGSVLFDVFGERFDDGTLRGLTPGLRREPPPAAQLG